MTLKIRLLSQGLIIHNPSKALVYHLEKNIHPHLIAPKLTRERGKFHTEDGDKYYYVDEVNNDYYYHIKQLEAINGVLDILTERGQLGEVVYIKEGVAEGTDTKFKNYRFDLRISEDNPEIYDFYGFQNEVSDTACEPGRYQTIFEIQTGRGKTRTFQKAMVRLKKRTCIIVRPAYKMKWKTDIVDDESGTYEPGPRVKVVSGVEGINAILHDGKSGELDKRNISVIIIPTTSLKLWLEAHAKSHMRDRINLWEFFDILGCGLVGYDEIHEHFHTVYLTGMVLNPPKLIEMSATLTPSKRKEFIRHRYLERFPLSNRVHVPYIRVCQIGFFYYSINCTRMVNRSNSMPMYNHKTFEDYLYQHGMMDDYFDMMYELTVRGLFNNYQEGQRGLIFFSLIQTCTDFREYMVKRMKDEGRKELNVNRYVGDDKYEELLNSDIAISTPGKAGTAVDLPGLVLVIVSTAIDDRQLNEQIAGRPRRVVKWEGVVPRVIFLHAREIKKHGNYLTSRHESLKPVAKSLDIISTDYVITGNNKEDKSLSPTSSSKVTVVSKFKKVKDKLKKFQQSKMRQNKRMSRKSFRNRKGRR